MTLDKKYLTAIWKVTLKDTEAKNLVVFHTVLHICHGCDLTSFVNTVITLACYIHTKVILTVGTVNFLRFSTLHTKSPNLIK